MAADLPSNDNALPIARLVPIVGEIREGGVVVLRPGLQLRRPAAASAEVIAWPNDPREP